METIQRRVRDLQRELRSPSSPWIRLEEAGLLVPVLGLGLGICAQRAWDPGTAVARSLLVALALLAPLAWRQRHRRGLVLLYSLAAFGILGQVRTGHAQRPRPHGIAEVLRGGDRIVGLRGTVASHPMVWGARPALPRVPATTFEFHVRQARGPRAWTVAQGRIAVRVAEPLEDLCLGRSLEIHGWLQTPHPATNPGQPDRAASLARRGIAAELSVKGGAGLSPWDEGPRLGVLSVIHRWTQARLFRHLDPNTPAGGLLRALVLGDRSRIPPPIYDAFARTGLLHLISLSGLHVGVLLALVWRLGRVAGLLHRGRAALSLGVLLAFLLVVPPRAATGRAAVIGGVFCLGALLGRPARPAHSLACAALLLLLGRPTQLVEPGFQLTFACASGICLWAGPLRRWTDARVEGVQESLRAIAPGPVRWLSPPLRGALRLLCVGLAAWLGGLGVLLAHFHTVQPLACLWTVLTLPLIALLLGLGLLHIVLGGLPGFGLLTAGPLGVVLWATLTLIRGLARVDPGPWVVGTVPLLAPLGIYAFLAAVTLLARARPAGARRLAGVGAALWVSYGLIVTAGHRHLPGVRVTCLDVGHGQAVVVQSGSQVTLIDVGSLMRPQVARSTVVPFLNAAGIGTVDTLVLTHADGDHVNGVPQLLRYRRVRRILVPEPMRARLAPSLARHPRLGTLPERLSPAPGVAFERLGPSAVPASTSDNDLSAVLLLRAAGRRVLFCGDIEAETQADLLARHPGLGADVVVAPHHGSRRTLHPAFLQQLAPRTVLCSCSATQLAHGQVITHWPGTRVLHTADRGALSLRIRPDGRLTVSAFNEREPRRGGVAPGES